ncbi:hypothetical protein ABZ370_36620 [Streptomyces sp. NPDC005962]
MSAAWSEALRLLADVDYDDPRAAAVRGDVERRLAERGETN